MAIAAMLGLGVGLPPVTAAQSFPAEIELSALDGVIGFALNGEAAFDFSGRSVSGAGDVNGDGIDDLIIGASNVPNGNPSGRSYVVFGSDAGFTSPIDLGSLNGTNGFVLNGEAASDLLGSSVAGAGDVNGDGVDDLIVGAPGAGRSYVVFGSATPFTTPITLSSLDGTNGFVLNGEAVDNAGYSVAGAGDVNGDDIDDLIVSDFGSGRTYVVFGSDAGFTSPIELSELDGTNGFVMNGEAVDNAGWSVAGAGDVNFDGIDDLIVGARAASRSYVVFGSATPFTTPITLSSLDGTNGFVLNGEATSDQSGWSVASAGDVNGDGIDDLIVGAPRAASSGNRNSGRSYVVFGSDAGFTSPIELSALDGTKGLVLNGEAADDFSGFSVAGAGDLNGDGVDDLIVGARWADPNGTDSGRSYVLFGSDAGFTSPIELSELDGTNGFVLNGEAANDDSGLSVAAAGDLNGDGVDDLVVGSLRGDGNVPNSGRTYVVYGGIRGPGTGRIEVVAEPAAADFGDVLVSGATLDIRMELVNASDQDARLGRLTLDAPFEFFIVNDLCSGQLLGTTVGVDDRCSFDVRFLPNELGLFQGKVIATYFSVPGALEIPVTGFVDGLFIDRFEGE